MGQDYLPKRAHDLAAWAGHFRDGLAASPGTYGLVQSDVTYVGRYVEAFIDALSRATDPATRTAVSVAAKDGARAAMADVLRGYAQRIRRNRGISSASKAALGLPIHDARPSPRPAPTSAPVVYVLGAQPGEQTLRYADVNTPTSRGKPFGAIGLQLFVWVGDAPPLRPDDGRFVGLITRQPFVASFDESERGRTAYYTARWQTRTGKVGPWSAVVSMVIV